MVEDHHGRASRPINLPSLGTSIRVLFTGYLVVVSVGLAMSGAQILMTHGKADGKFGLSVDDIVYSYYGNRGDSRMEAKLEGTMKDKAPTDKRARIVKWIRNGSPEAKWESDMQPIFNEYCVKCHGTIPGLPSFRTYPGVTALTEIDKGKTVDALTRVSHIHLFGIAFIFVFVCSIFSLTVGVPRWLKSTAIALPFAFIVVDILSWWLTAWVPSFAYMTICGGFGYAVASAFMILTSMYQMWILPRKGREFPSNELFDN